MFAEPGLRLFTFASKSFERKMEALPQEFSNSPPADRVEDSVDGRLDCGLAHES
jgi:hypothetical protein